MSVLGIDPGSRKLGFGLISDAGELEDFGVLRLPVSFSVGKKLSLVREFLLSERFTRVRRVGVESGFVGINPRAYLVLGYFRGIVHLVAEERGWEIVEVAPAEARRSLFGLGSVGKEEVRRLLVARYPGWRKELESVDADATDAIAVALAALGERWG